MRTQIVLVPLAAVAMTVQNDIFCRGFRVGFTQCLRRMKQCVGLVCSGAQTPGPKLRYWRWLSFTKYKDGNGKLPDVLLHMVFIHFCGLNKKLTPFSKISVKVLSKSYLNRSVLEYFLLF